MVAQGQIGVCLDDHASGLDVVLPDRVVQRGVAIVRPLGVDVDAVLDQQLGRLSAPGISRGVQSGGLHTRIDRRDVSVGLEQQTGDLGVAKIGGHDQWNVAGCVDRVHVDILGDQLANLGRVVWP